jgi:hypothetical protein
MNRIVFIFAGFGAWMLIASVVSLAGGPCLAWKGSVACSFGFGDKN